MNQHTNKHFPWAILVIVLLAAGLFGIASNDVRAQAAAPAGFCTTAPPANPGWQVTGAVTRPADCPEAGLWAMSLNGTVTRHASWTEMDSARAQQGATLYFEGAGAASPDPNAGGGSPVPGQVIVPASADAHQRRLMELDPTFRSGGETAWLQAAGIVCSSVTVESRQPIEETFTIEGVKHSFVSGLVVRGACDVNYPNAVSTDRPDEITKTATTVEVPVDNNSVLYTNVRLVGQGTVYADASNWGQFAHLGGNPGSAPATLVPPTLVPGLPAATAVPPTAPAATAEPIGAPALPTATAEPTATPEGGAAAGAVAPATPIDWLSWLPLLLACAVGLVVIGVVLAAAGVLAKVGYAIADALTPWKGIISGFPRWIRGLNGTAGTAAVGAAGTAGAAAGTAVSAGRGLLGWLWAVVTWIPRKLFSLLAWLWSCLGKFGCGCLTFVVLIAAIVLTLIPPHFWGGLLLGGWVLLLLILWLLMKIFGRKPAAVVAPAGPPPAAAPTNP